MRATEYPPLVAETLLDPSLTETARKRRVILYLKRAGADEVSARRAARAFTARYARTEGGVREALMRARFLLGSSLRMVEGSSAAREIGLFVSHRSAAKNRTRAYKATAEAAKEWGPILSWRAVLDERTTKDCERAHGKNFRAAAPPVMGVPGSVHPYCRCVPGPPIKGARMLR